jgi:Uncharacterised nucleotidyltransferase
MMAPTLVDHSDVPSEVREYFAAVQLLTGQEAKVLLALSAEIVSALRAIGARPVLLKGAAAVAQGLYPSHDLRLMTDIDILIADPKMKESIAALLLLDYREPRKNIVRPSEQYHRLLVHGPTGIPVELHNALSVAKFAALLSAQEALSRATSISANEMMFSVLAPTDRIVYHVLHAQLHHPYWQDTRIELRQLVDLAILVDAFGGDIDWTAVQFRFSANGYANVLADYLACLALLLGRRVSAHISDLEMVTARLRAGVQAPPKGVSAIASEYWKGFRGRPSLAINLIDPRFWPGRLRSWRERLRPN